MAITTKKPFIYSMANKYNGEPNSSSSSAQLAPNGVHKLVLASTYTLAGPSVGSLVTLYSVGVDASVVSKTTSGGQVAFNGMGGTQVLNLLYDSTVGNDPCVTLLGEATTQWRVIGFTNAAAYATSNSGISIST
jgi:hypothetical protein